MEGDRHFGKPSPCQACLDDHLGRELHAGAALAELSRQLPPESAQAAVDVVDRSPEPPAPQPGENRIPEPAVEPGHRTGQNTPPSGGQTAALDDLEALPQLFDEARNLPEVVAGVRITHDDEPAARRGNPSHQRAPIAPGLDNHHARSEPLRDAGRPVGASIVRNHDLPFDPGPAQRALRFPDADGQRVRLVETGNDDGDLARTTRTIRPRRRHRISPADSHRASVPVASSKR